MTRVIFGIFILLWCSVSSTQERLVQCQGHTIIKVGDRIGAKTPFHAVFQIEGGGVTMTEGDFSRFSTNYRADSEINRPGRPGYKSNNGNLFFFLDSERFEIFKMDVVSGVGLTSESTTGTCKKFDPNDVFTGSMHHGYAKSTLTTQHKKDLTVFGLRSMGMNAGLGDVKKVLSEAEVKELVLAGINLNGHLCAEILDIRPLEIAGAYEVSCIAYRGGSAKKAYLLEALEGIASEM